MMLHRASSFIESCNTCPIGQSAVCARCDLSEMADLESVKFYRHVAAGRSIVRAGDDITFVASVVSGMAILTRTMEDGRRLMLGLLLPSDFIGRPGRTTAALDIIATTPVLLCCFHRKSFENRLATTPHLGERLLQMSLDELDAARDWMLLLGRKTARERVASLLVLVARKLGKQTDVKDMNVVAFDMPLTRNQMADYLGMTEETVSRQMTKLKREGVIVLEGLKSIRVEDFRRLMEQSGEDADGGMIV